MSGPSSAYTFEHNPALGQLFDVSRLAPAGTALAHRIKYEDCRFKFDRQTGRAITLDVGTVIHARQEGPVGTNPIGSILHGLGFQRLQELNIVTDTLRRFISYRPHWPQLEKVALRYVPGDPSSVHSILTRHRRRGL